MPTARTADELSIPGIEVHYLHSEHVGNGTFASAVDTIRFMQLSAHLPPMVVVGSGYRMGGIAGTEVVRAREFTPADGPR